MPAACSATMLLWAPVGPLVRAQFETIDDSPPLFADDWHSMVDLDAWRVDRSGFVDSRPVIGRHSRPDLLKWPDTRELTLAAYPDDPRFLVRVLGGGPYLLGLLGAYPRNWQVHGFNAMPAERFLATIDFFVYFHHSRWVEAFGRTIIEAMASGALAILAPHFQPLFGNAAVYAEPQEAADLVQTYRANPKLFREQVERGWAAVRTRFSHAAYVERLRALIGPPRPTTVAVPHAVAPRPLRVLLMSSNGIGVGHLTRMLAIARRCPAPLEPVFVTLSQAVRVVREQGFLAEYLPFHTYLGCDIGRWNSFLREELNELISFYDPRVFVFDGHVPYGGLVGALDDNRQLASVWCRRGMWGSHQGAETIKRERHFDAVIEPGDLAESFDQGLTTRYRERTRTVAPIRLLDPEEMLDARRGARRALGLRAQDPAALVLLGSGNNYDYEPVRKVVFARLGRAEARADRGRGVAQRGPAGGAARACPAPRRLPDQPLLRRLRPRGQRGRLQLVPRAAVRRACRRSSCRTRTRSRMINCRARCSPRARAWRYACAGARSIGSGRRSTGCSMPTLRAALRARCATLAAPNGAIEAGAHHRGDGLRAPRRPPLRRGLPPDQAPRSIARSGLRGPGIRGCRGARRRPGARPGSRSRDRGWRSVGERGPSHRRCPPVPTAGTTSRRPSGPAPPRVRPRYASPSLSSASASPWRAPSVYQRTASASSLGKPLPRA